QRTTASNPEARQRGRGPHQLHEIAARGFVELQLLRALGEFTLQPTFKFARTFQFTETPPMDPGRFLFSWMMPLSLHSNSYFSRIRKPESMVTGRAILRGMDIPGFLQMGADEFPAPVLALVGLFQLLRRRSGFPGEIGVKRIGLEILGLPRQIGDLVERPQRLLGIPVALE